MAEPHICTCGGDCRADPRVARCRYEEAVTEAAALAFAALEDRSKRDRAVADIWQLLRPLATDRVSSVTRKGAGDG